MMSCSCSPTLIASLGRNRFPLLQGQFSHVGLSAFTTVLILGGCAVGGPRGGWVYDTSDASTLDSGMPYASPGADARADTAPDVARTAVDVPVVVDSPSQTVPDIFSAADVAIARDAAPDARRDANVWVPADAATSCLREPALCRFDSDCCDRDCFFGVCFDAVACSAIGSTCLGNVDCCSGYCGTGSRCAEPLRDAGTPRADAAPDAASMRDASADLCLSTSDRCTSDTQCCSRTCTRDTRVCSSAARACVAPIDLNVEGTRTGNTFTIIGSTIGMPATETGRCGGDASGSPEIAYAFVAPVSGPVTITTNFPETVFDTIVYVRSSCDGIELACNDDISATAGPSRLTMTMTAGQRAIIFVDGWALRGPAQGYFKLQLSM